ncbi:hypothetical protein GGU11DRAFT_759257 [Lentinula aff. detonsa]|nr:hypothetical protein GGU11DRAFT_759257 [Lentinula aff. detonsa]
MTRELELNCLVLDSHASINRIFPVQISETDMVATLKEKIKQKARPVFEHIDAHTLDLWNVSVPVEELSETHLHDLQPAHAPLPPVKRLSRLFPNTPPEEQLHIIIQPPEIATSPNPQPLLELNCLVLGDQRNHIFPVKIAKTKSVGSLKKAVKEKKRPLSNHVPADDLALWRVSEVVDQNLEDNLEKINFLEKESLSPADELYKVFSNLPVKGRLHIVVGWPIDESQQDDEQEGAVFDPSLQRRRLDSFDFARPTKRARTVQDDEESPSTFLRRLRNKALKAELPTLAALRAFLNTPLEESVKIPISHTQFNGILSERPDDICTREDVSAVFKIGEAGLPSLELMQALRAPRFSRTEVGYTHFWDFNIRDILQVLIPEAECIRDSNYYTGIGKIFPDFSFLIHKRCVFRGEEKGPMSPEDPALQLIENMVWEYDSAPYILGYYADETVVTLEVHCSPNPQPEANDQYELYPSLTCGNGTPSQSQLSNAHETYTCADGLDRVRHLRWVYRTLKEANVPNTDSLITFKGGNVFLEPVGRAAPPNTVGQLRECILCVLDALEIAHRIPLYHRDIRKENIIQRIDDPSKWFLIDWEHASTMPTLAQPNFARETHSPAIFENNHGQEVDIWGVGYLILDADGLILPEIRELGDRICRDSLKLTVLQTRDLVTAVFQEHQGR